MFQFLTHALFSRPMVAILEMPKYVGYLTIIAHSLSKLYAKARSIKYALSSSLTGLKFLYCAFWKR